MAVITRRDYLAQSTAAHRGDLALTPQEAHEAYYAQFVTPATLRWVEGVFGVDLLRKNLPKDRHLNSIPLERWDSLSWASTSPRGRSTSRAGARTGTFRAILPFDREAVSAAGETVTRAVLVCIAKCAARMVVERSTVTAAAA